MSSYVICCEYRQPRAQAGLVSMFDPAGATRPASVMSLDRDLLPETSGEGMSPESGSVLLVADLEWHAADKDMIRGLRDFFSIIEPVPPVPSRESLGYDVCEQYAYSLLFERSDGRIRASSRLGGTLLNQHGLIDDLADAIRFAQGQMGPESSDFAFVTHLYTAGQR